MSQTIKNYINNFNFNDYFNSLKDQQIKDIVNNMTIQDRNFILNEIKCFKENSFFKQALNHFLRVKNTDNKDRYQLLKNLEFGDYDSELLTFMLKYYHIKIFDWLRLEHAKYNYKDVE